jgi:hypothetical protein
MERQMILHEMRHLWIALNLLALAAFGSFLLHWPTALVGDARAEEATTTAPAAASEAPLNPRDVSWLFPAPRDQNDLANLISISELMAPSAADSSKREQIWPDEAFMQFIKNANAVSVKGASGPAHKLTLPKEVEDKAVWHIAGLRIDPGAPGLTPEIMEQYGQQPQIRFILQPVTREPGGKVKVHDIAAHVIYSFLLGPDTPALQGCLPPRLKADKDAFRQVVKDFAALRDQLKNGDFGGVRIDTSNHLLDVHPGLANPKTAKAVRDALVNVLERHLDRGKLTGMAIMGIPNDAPEPWMFVAMAPDPKTASPSMPQGNFGPVPGASLSGLEFAEALAVTEKPEVIPTPAPNNLNAITCRNNLGFGSGSLPLAERKGLATAELFALGDKPLHNPEEIAKVKKTVDLIADPKRSHFFNTDCVSCHTDTRRALELLGERGILGVAAGVLPKDKWNVRNFGWFPGSILHPSPNVATVTRRTAAETAAVLDFINKNGLAK